MRVNCTSIYCDHDARHLAPIEAWIEISFGDQVIPQPSCLIVESMRGGLSPKDAGMDALKRIKANTIEKRLLNSKGNPNFNIRFFVLYKGGEYAGVAMYHAGETRFAACTENGAQALELEPLLPGAPED